MSTFSPPRSLASRSGKRHALVGLTPLIDVVFILLIFFMLVSSFVDWRTIILAPPAAASGRSQGFAGAVLVEIREGGDVRLSGEVMKLDDMTRRLEAIISDRQGRRVIVKTEEGVPLLRLVNVVDHLSAAGVDDMTFALEE